jgi:hypothetical protein
MSRYINVDKIEYHEDDAVYRHEINAIPTADVRENVQGEWLHERLISDTGYIHGECSICHKVRVVDNFCPNCGARMEEKDG